MNIDDLKDPEFQGKLKEADGSSQLVELFKEEGVELSDRELENIAGGAWGSSGSPQCPNCGSTNVTDLGQHSMGDPNSASSWRCNSCQGEWDG